MAFQGNSMNFKEIKSYDSALEEVKVRCKCGHRVIIPYWVDKQLCNWCKSYVFRDKKIEFEYRMKEKVKRVDV